MGRRRSGLLRRPGPDYCPSGYPHHYFMHKPTTDLGGEWDVIEIEGAHARGFCNVAMTNDVYALRPGECQPTWVLEPDGRLMSAGLLKRPGEETTRFQLLVPKANEPRVAHWLRALSDGYVDVDDDDPFVRRPARSSSGACLTSWPMTGQPSAPPARRL